MPVFGGCVEIDGGDAVERVKIKMVLPSTVEKDTATTQAKQSHDGHRHVTPAATMRSRAAAASCCAAVLFSSCRTPAVFSLAPAISPCRRHRRIRRGWLLPGAYPYPYPHPNPYPNPHRCRQRQGRAIAMSKDGGDDANGRDKKKKGVRIRNSYLKIVMDDGSVDRLHAMAQRIRHVMKEAGEMAASVSDDDEHGNEEKERSQTRPLTFKPRSRQSLHMTFFFGGTTLCELPPDELLEWHGEVMDRLKQEQAEDVLRLEFRELRLFPPRRRSLIVAIFEASPALHRLHDDLRDIAQSSRSEGLRTVVRRSQERWTAHVTLGDLRGGGRGEGKKARLQELDHVLKDGMGLDCLGEGGEKEEMMAKVKGVAMGGPVPQQVELNWDHHFC